jgi:hypothetical protein
MLPAGWTDWAKEIVKEAIKKARVGVRRSKGQDHAGDRNRK